MFGIEFRRLVAASCLLVCCQTPALPQQEPSRFDRLSALEASDDLKAYRKELTAGGEFTQRHRQLLLADGLPQLLAEGNRRNLAYVRGRLASLFLDDITNAAARGKANTAAIEGLVELAVSERTAIEGSVNAALLLGELRDEDGGPLAEATAAVEKLLLAESLAPAVRVAALQGLVPRVEAAGAGAADDRKQAAVALLPTLDTLLLRIGGDEEAASPGLEPVVRIWLQQRVVDLAAGIAPLAAADFEPLAAIGQKVLSLLEDAASPVDLRVRAARFLADRVGSESGPDPEELIDLIGATAVAAVVEDRSAIKRIELGQFLSSGVQGGMSMQPAEASMMGPGMMPGPGMATGPDGSPLPAKPSLLPVATCLRTSWRLVSLSEALATIAKALGEKGEPLEQRAGRWRELGIAIYEKPGDEAVLAAATELAPEPDPEPVETEPGPKPAAGERPGLPPGRPRPVTPFSPFMNR